MKSITLTINRRDETFCVGERIKAHLLAIDCYGMMTEIFDDQHIAMHIEPAGSFKGGEMIVLSSEIRGHAPEAQP